MYDQSQETTPYLQVRKLAKTFGENTVLRDVTLELRRGDFHALVGENGAGKSTFINLICGIHRPDSGSQILIEGKEISNMTPNTAQSLGISVVHQELSLCHHLTVAENIFLGRELRTPVGLLRKRKMNACTAELLNEVGLGDISPDSTVKTLSLAQQQMIEFVKTLYQNPKLLILDEATSALDPEQVATMFSILKKKQVEDGLSVVFISHRLQENFDLCGAMTVLKDGAHIVTIDLEGISTDQLVTYMTGRQISDIYPPKPDIESVLKQDVILSAKNITTGRLKNISFDLHHGEILGIGGLQGQGQEELMQALFGVKKIRSGKLELKGKPIIHRHPSDAMKNAVAYIPAERKTEGAFLPFTIRENISFVNFSAICSAAGTVRKKKEADLANKGIKELQVKTWGQDQTVGSLSGGNQQKVILAKWLERKPEILLLNEPTRGIDVGTKKEIYDILRRLAKQGVAVIMISSDTMELIGLCDRAIVLYEHTINGELVGDELHEQSLVHAAVVKKEAAPA